MIIINGAFLSNTGVISGNTASKTQYDFHNGLVMGSEEIYDRYNFFIRALVDGVSYNNELEYYRAIGVYYNEPIYDQYSYMQNVTFDGFTPVGNQYEYYYQGVGAYIGAGGGTPSTTAFFSVDNQTPITGETVTFTDSSTYFPDTWAWDFGDGNTSSLQNPTHSYSATGSFTVSLTASNTFGGSGGEDNETKVDYVVTGLVPVAGISLSSPSCTGESNSFINTTVASGTPTYAWDFGDGSTSASENPTHSYSATGSFTVGLTASDVYGTDYTSDTIDIATTPTSNFIASTYSTETDVTVTFTDTSTDTPSGWAWDFGDGSTSTSQNPTHSYSATGSFTVGLTASNGCGDGTYASDTIGVTSSVIPSTLNDAIAYYDMEDGNDSINSYDLTTSAGWTSVAGGKNGNKGRYSTTATPGNQNFVGSALDCPLQLTNPAYSYSLSSWVYFEDLNTSGNCMLYHQRGGYLGAPGPQREVTLSYDYNGGTRRWRISVYNGSSYNQYYNQTLTADTWYNVVMIQNLTNIKVYLNGLLIMNVTDSNTGFSPGSYDAQQAIGNYGGGGSSITGYMDEVGVWDRALLLGEVLELYNSGTGKFYPFVNTPSSSTLDDVVAYYDMENWNDKIGSYNMTNNLSNVTSNGVIGSMMAFDIGSSDATIGMYTTGSNCPMTDNKNTGVNSYHYWVKFVTTTNEKNISRLMGQSGRLIDVRRSSTQWKIGIYADSTGVQSYTYNQSITNDQWYSVAYVHNLTSIKLYINGVEVINISSPSDGTSSGGNWNFNSFAIGNSVDLNESIRGYIDECGFWDRVLTPTEINELYLGRFY